MVVAVRAEAVITAQNQLRPGLSAAAAELARFKSRQAQAFAAFNAQTARAATASARNMAAAQAAADRRAGTAAMLLAARQRKDSRSQVPSAGLLPVGGLGAGAVGAAAGGYAVVAGLRNATRQALSFERELYNVQRATDSSGEALRNQGEFLLDLSRATGKTKEELAQLYAAAGFAGRPVNELGRFTDYAAKATVAWGTSAETTGQALAEIGNIYGAKQGRIEEIGDAINTIADKSASKETDLLDFLKRVGGQAAILGISAENVLAFGAALKEVGVQTEVAATGFSSAILNKALVPDDDFDKKLVKAGINAKKFRKVVEQDATKGIVTLLEGVNKLEGVKKLGVLKDLFGLEYADDVARLAGALSRLNDLRKIAGDRKAYLGSVRQGFSLALEKDFNKIARAERAMDAWFTRIGDNLKLIVGGLAEQFNALDESTRKAESSAKRIADIHSEARKREGNAEPPPAPAGEKRESYETRALRQIASGDVTELTLTALAQESSNDKIKKAAENALRDRVFARADKTGSDKQRSLIDLSNSLLGRGFGADAGRPDQARGLAAMAEAERRRIAIMQHQFDLIGFEAGVVKKRDRQAIELESSQRRGSFFNMPQQPLSRQGLTGPLAMLPAGMVRNTVSPVSPNDTAFGRRRMVMPDLPAPASPTTRTSPRSPYSLMPPPEGSWNLFDKIRRDLGDAIGLRSKVDEVKFGGGRSAPSIQYDGASVPTRRPPVRSSDLPGEVSTALDLGAAIGLRATVDEVKFGGGGSAPSIQYDGAAVPTRLPPVRPADLPGKVSTARDIAAALGDAPTKLGDLDTAGLDAARSKAVDVRSTIESLGPAGASAGTALGAGISSGLSQADAAIDAFIARTQQKLNSLRAPQLSFGGGSGGFDTGKQGAN